MFVKNADGILLSSCNIESTRRVRYAGDEEQETPLMQRVLDNPFILLFLGVAFPALLYLIWGIMEVVSIPIGN